MNNMIMEVMTCARDIYRNCARTLLAADLLMEERGFSKYSWSHLYEKDPTDPDAKSQTKYLISLKDADVLLPAGYFFHQYYLDGRVDKDVVTVCVAPWRRRKPETFRPVCCATRFASISTADDTVYWIGTIPIWEETNKFDGKLRQYGLDAEIWNGYSDMYRKSVLEGSTVSGIAVPLEDVTTSAILAEKLIDPLLVE